jgi:hypothetical protein
MPSARRRPRPSVPEHEPGGSFDALRLAFLARLRDERVHFVTSSAALARAETNRASILQELRFRAHKIRGGAAIFEIAGVDSAACALEEAAIRASMGYTTDNDAEVRAVLVALVKVMG